MRGSQSMAKITYIDSAGTARTIDAALGSTVMETAIKNDVPGIEAECGGGCACAAGPFHVDGTLPLTAGGSEPAAQDRLDFRYDVEPHTRLSLQINLTHGLTR